MSHFNELSRKKAKFFLSLNKIRLRRNFFILCLFSCSLFALVFLSVLTGCQKEDIPPEDPTEEPVSSTPTLEISNLARGAFLQSESMDDMDITVEGKACDPINPVTKVTINNNAVVLEADGDCNTFSADVQGNWGLNIIDMVVENKLGDEVSMVQSYLQSSEYFPAPDAVVESTMLPVAWRGRLGQEVLDDGDRGDIDDFASVIELAINHYDFNQAIPNTLVSPSTKDYGCIWPIADKTNRSGFSIIKSGPFDIGTVQVNSLFANPDIIEVNFTIGRSAFPLRVDGYADLGCAGELHAGTTGAIGFKRVDVSGSFDVRFSNQKVEVSLNNANIDFTGLFVQIDLTGVDLIDDLISEASSIALSVFQNTIERLFVDILENNINDILEDLLNDFSVDPVIDIPAPVNVQLNVNSILDDLEVGHDYIDLGLAARVTPSEYKKDDSQLERGSIIGASTLPSFNGMSGTFGLGMKDDFVNQVLWAVWAGGGFDEEDGNIGEIADALATAGLNASILSIETGLPPVLMPGDNDSEVKIGFGEIQVETEISPLLLGQLKIGSDKVKMSSYISLILTGTFQVQAETREMIFVPSGTPEIHVQINDYVRTNESIDLEEKLGDFAGELLIKYLTEVIDGIELPSIPVGEHVDGVPSGTTWVLDNGTMDHAAGYHRIIGEVGVEEE